MESLESLYAEICDRKTSPKNGSYTNYLFDQGLDKILKKVGEETSEVIIAAKNQDNQELIAESSDLLYHLLVLFAEAEVPLTAIESELESRQGKISQIKERKKITEI